MLVTRPQKVGMSVLLIDDDPGIRKLLGRELARRKLDIQTAATGKEGLALLDRLDFQVVVCDVRMPDLDGLEVLRKIKEREPDTTEVIMLTGHGTIETAIEAIKAGVPLPDEAGEGRGAGGPDQERGRAGHPAARQRPAPA